jgi:hypothetical protein
MMIRERDPTKAAVAVVGYDSCRLIQSVVSAVQVDLNVPESSKSTL